MNSITKHLFSLVFVISAVAAIAQPGWNWGDSVDKAKEKNALYADFVKAENLLFFTQKVLLESKCYYIMKFIIR